MAAAVMNGLIIWIFAIINWFRRTIYHFKNAVSVYGTPAAAEENNNSWTFTFDYNGETQTVFVYEPSGRVDLEHLLTDDGKVELLWIPGKKRAMLVRYYNNTKLLVCDIGSIAALALMIMSFVLIAILKGSDANTASYLTLFSAGAMIVLSIIRRQCKK